MDFSIIDAVTLGLIQGFTEFLPISSSGHLVLAKNTMGIIEVPILFDVFYHFATLLSIFAVYRKDIKNIFDSFLGLTGIIKNDSIDKENINLIKCLIIGTIPAGTAGLLFEDQIKGFFNSVEAVSIALMITGLILISTKFIKYGEKNYKTGSAIIVGLCQVLALFPGISRSGTTITGSLWLRIKPQDAVKFSFFLAIPVVLGANILEFSHISVEELKSSILLLLSGGTAAFISGYAAILAVKRLIETGKFFVFGIYCILIGIISYTIF